MSEPATDAPAHLTRLLIDTGIENRDAFRELYTLTAAKLFGICLRICGDRVAAEDVLHDVYLTIWKRAGAYEPGRGTPIIWLATIARNRAIDWRRKHGRRIAVALDDAPALPDPAPDAETVLLLDETSKRLHDCLSELDHHQRDAIQTAFFFGYTYAELAERSNVPLGTMKSWVRRGLGQMRECLEKA